MDLMHQYLYNQKIYLLYKEFLNEHFKIEDLEIKVKYRVSKDEEVASYSQILTEALLDIFVRNQKIYLPMSGGVDSEILAMICLRNKIPFIPIIVEVEGINLYDIYWVKRFLKENSITNYIWKKIKLSDLFGSLGKKITSLLESNCYLLTNLILACLEAENGSVCVIASDSPVDFWIHKDSLHLIRPEYGLCPNKFKINHPEGPEIIELYHNPRVMEGFLNLPAIRERVLNSSHVIDNPIYCDMDLVSREALYNEFLPEYNLMRRFSVHGFESAKPQNGYFKEVFFGRKIEEVFWHLESAENLPLQQNPFTKYLQEMFPFSTPHFPLVFNKPYLVEFHSVNHRIKLKNETHITKYKNDGVKIIPYVGS